MSSTLPITPPETPHTSLSVSSELKSEVPTPSQPVNSTHFKRDLQVQVNKVGGNNNFFLLHMHCYVLISTHLLV